MDNQLPKSPSPPPPAPDRMEKIEGWPGRIFCYRELPSTNTLLLQTLGEYPDRVQEYDVVWASFQSEGRGRREKRWLSPGPEEGRVLTFSVAVPLMMGKAGKGESQAGEEMGIKVASLPQVAAWCWWQILHRHGVEVRLKWPNDILLQGGKLCGILTETLNRGGRGHAVIGMGINLKLEDDFLKRIESETGRRVISLDRGLTAPHRLLDPFTALGVFLPEFKSLLDLWHERGFVPFAEGWKEQTDLIGKTVVVVSDDRREEVMVEDITPDGFLMARDKSGSRKQINFGEIEY